MFFMLHYSLFSKIVVSDYQTGKMASNNQTTVASYGISITSIMKIFIIFTGNIISYCQLQ